MNKAVPSALLCLVLVPFLAGCRNAGKAIAHPDDASDAKIGVMTGSTGERIAAARFPHARVSRFDDIMDAVTAMKSGQLDAIITSYPTALQITRKNAELWRLPEQLDNEDAAIAIKKGHDELLSAVNGIITGLKNDGTLDDMKTRWFKDDATPYREKDITLPKDGPVLAIGVSTTREPYTFVDKDGRVTGHDAELARIIGMTLHRPVAFSSMKFMSLIPALQSGKVDMIVTGMIATDERRKSVDFTQPYYASAQVMVAKKGAAQAGAAAQLASPSDLKDKKIGVLLGSVHDTYAAKTYPNATVLQYKTPSDIVLAVKSGKVDAAIYTHETLLEMLRKDDELALMGKPLFSVSVGTGFNKENDGLRGQFNAFLRQTRENGVYDDMVNRWITTGNTQMPDISSTKSNGVLTVGIVSDKGLPFTIVQDNRMIGFDVELTERFAAFLGKEPRLMDMEFGSLIAAVSTNKIDMVTSTLMITEERKKQIAFSDPYYELHASVFALRKNIAGAGGGASAAPVSLFRGIANSFQSNIIQEKRYLLILDGLKTTMVISVFATLFGTLLGALVCFMRMSKEAVLNLPARIYISILRGTPVLVVLMLIFYVVFARVGIDPVIVAIIAFGMNFAAYAAEIFRTGIEGVDKGQTEAGIAMGFTRAATFAHIVMPQTVRRILPVYKGELISLVKMTSIVGYIAVQDLTKASDIIRSRTFDAFFPLVMIAILYFLISWLLMQSLDYVERATDPKHKRRKVRGA